MSELSNFEQYFTPEIVQTFAKVHQARSRFQIEKFVVGAQDVPEMQYHQIITEIQHLYYTIKQASLEVEKAKIEIDRLRATGDEIDELNAQIKELDLEQTSVVATGAFRELEILLDLKSKYPDYSREDIEAAQPEYWSKRLNRQATLEAIAGSQSGAAHLTALDQIGALENLIKLESKELQ